MPPVTFCFYLLCRFLLVVGREVEQQLVNRNIREYRPSGGCPAEKGAVCKKTRPSCPIKVLCKEDLHASPREGEWRRFGQYCRPDVSGPWDWSTPSPCATIQAGEKLDRLCLEGLVTGGLMITTPKRVFARSPPKKRVSLRTALSPLRKIAQPATLLAKDHA